jgi:hypothetical protein
MTLENTFERVTQYGGCDNKLVVVQSRFSIQ